MTGGANEMGLAVAQDLSKRCNWDIQIVDLNKKAGKAAVDSVSNATFHHCNIASYVKLGDIFKRAFQTSNRLDFVFANAGIHEIGSTGDFYATHNTDLEPPPEPTSKLRVVDICLDSVINASYLALHYFRQNKNHAKMDCNLFSSQLAVAVSIKATMHQSTQLPNTASSVSCAVLRPKCMQMRKSMSTLSVLERLSPKDPVQSNGVLANIYDID